MAGTKIIMGDAVSLIIGNPLDAVQESFYAAMENGGWVRVHPDEGPAVSINPRRVLYMEEVELSEEDLRQAARLNGSLKTRQPSPAR